MCRVWFFGGGDEGGGEGRRGSGVWKGKDAVCRLEGATIVVTHDGQELEGQGVVTGDTHQMKGTDRHTSHTVCFL